MNDPNSTPSALLADTSIPGMRIQCAKPGESWALVVRTTTCRADWVVEPQGIADRVSIMVTPTTILYHGQAYRIHEAEETPSGWIYRMQPCQDGETQLHVVELSADKVVVAARTQKEFVRVQTMAHRSAGYEILLGCLPAVWQEELSRRWHFSPADATRKNGMAAFLFGIGAAWPAMMLIHPYMGFIMMAAAMDGGIRWMSGFAAEKPLGLLPLELTERTVRCLVRLFMWGR